MKRHSLILVIIFLFSLAFCSEITAQEGKSEEKEKEMQEAIEAQKKAMIEEQKKAQEEMQKALEQSKKEIDKAMQNYREQMKENPEQYERIFRMYDDNGRTRVFSGNEPYVLGYTRFGDYNAERTTWEFSKNVKESTFARTYTFDVEKSVKNVMMSVNGDCREGDIRIKITMPNGKTYSDIVIDEYGNLNWRKSFTISETENTDKTGAWKFEISSSKATGFFKISLQTY
ncbi:MAG TPA: hypothetical protein PLV06_11715 [Bacteroidales bacterium]|nr:hypothetical protein [Bacteroidales bacterium]HPR13044.1 hypothetical protein [Bacteroidales bacterium]